VDNPIILTGVVFVGVLALAYLVTVITTQDETKRRRRMDEHAVPVAVREAKRLERRHVLKDYSYSSVGLVNAVLGRLRPAQTAAVELTRSNVALGVAPYLIGRVLLAVVAFYIVRTFTGSLIFAIPAVPVGLMLPRIVLIVKARRRHKAFEGQLAEAIDMMVGALRAGFGFLQSIESVSTEMPNPIRQEFARVLEQVNVGTPPVVALAELPERIDSYDLDMFVTAVTVQRSVGGNLAEVLENIAETVRERRRIRAEVHAITTGPRVTSYILGLFPVGLMMFFLTTDDYYRQIMMDHLIGKLMLGFAGVWAFIGFLLSSAVAKVEY